MSFLAKLFINGRVINVLDTNIQFYQQVNPSNFKPAALPMGGVFNLTVEADGTTDLLGLALSPDTMCEGYIRFYKRDGMSKMMDYEFFDTHIVSYQRNFEGYYGKVTTDRYVLSPGILRIGDMVFEKPWKVTDINRKKVEATPEPILMKEDEPEFLGYHFEDMKGEIIRKEEIRVNDQIYLVIEAENAVGENVDINMEDKSMDYEYNGSPVENDILRNIVLTSNITKVKLKAIKQQNQH